MTMTPRAEDHTVRSVVLQNGVRSGSALGAVLFVLLLVVTLPVFPTVLELPFVAVAVAAPVAVYALTGVRVMRATGRLVAGTMAGALTGALSGALGGLSILGVNLLFLDTVSRQPEKILNFHASGLPTMHDYLLRNGLLNTGMGLVAGALGGALVATGGALLWRWWLTRQQRETTPVAQPKA